jgi:hypothetical protein
MGGEQGARLKATERNAAEPLFFLNKGMSPSSPLHGYAHISLATGVIWSTFRSGRTRSSLQRLPPFFLRFDGSVDA